MADTPAAPPPPRRRGLLAALGGATAAAAAAPAALAQDRADSVPAGMARKETEAEKRAPRYRETDHVRAFYQTNRY